MQFWYRIWFFSFFFFFPHTLLFRSIISIFRDTWRVSFLSSQAVLNFSSRIHWENRIKQNVAHFVLSFNFLGDSDWSQIRERLFWKQSIWQTTMDIKDRRHRSLTRGRCGKECRYTSSSLDSEDCRVPTQKSYSSSETLKAYDHDTRMHYGNRVSDLVHRESDEFPRQGMFQVRTVFFYSNPW